jgi:hypothetical protein
MLIGNYQILMRKSVQSMRAGWVLYEAFRFFSRFEMNPAFRSGLWRSARSQ